LNDFLPISKEDVKERGWEQLDFIIITGDAYVDHPSFGAAVIGRVLESRGYKAGILAQPDWRNVKAFKALGRPRLGFLITSGSIDSMVNHYTAARKKRKNDSYSPGGRDGCRPDRAVIVYSQRAREAYSRVPIILGGIEASLRRLAHYDYWSDKIRRSILLDSRADLIVYGMGESQIAEIAQALDAGTPVGDLTNIIGTVYKTADAGLLPEHVLLPGYDEILESKKKFARSFMTQYRNMDSINGRILVEPYQDYYVVQNPPAAPLPQPELDAVYELPFMRTYHQSYEEFGGIPAITEVKFSLISNRGCFGGCSFCALTFHQGRVIQSRSHQSLITEAEKITLEPDFKGYIHDVGGPTANFQNVACEKQVKYGVCSDRQCLYPDACKNLKIDHNDYLQLMRKIREIPNIKKVFIRSGIRFDYLIYDHNDEFFKELCEYHVSGQLKVAPEHVSDEVLRKMGKPSRQVYEKFARKFYKINEELGLKQFLVPYLMSSHPGSRLKDAVELAEYLRDKGYVPEQVQDFYPTPGTLSACMYHTELDPRTMEKVYVPKDPHEKAMQRALIQYRNPKNYDLVFEALTLSKRTDLIGFDSKCLIRPRRPGKTQDNKRDNKGSYFKNGPGKRKGKRTGR